MTRAHIIRAWKDADYRNSLSDAERAQLPENPAGLVEVPQNVTLEVDGGGDSWFTGTCSSLCSIVNPVDYPPERKVESTLKMRLA